MENKIKKRAQIYGIAAVLLAIIIGSICYNFGVYPPESEPPLIIPSALLNTFSSYEELKTFLTENSGTQEFFQYYGSWGRFLAATPKGMNTYAEALDSGLEYSTTNIQVAGVDEADIVKTDGEHIYLISDNDIFIIKSLKYCPQAEAEVLSKITFNDSYPVGIFLDGDRLAVLGCRYVNSYWGYYESYYEDAETFVNIYDVSNKTRPALLRNFTMSGGYFNSRMIGEYVYFVVSQQASIKNDTVILPKVYSNEDAKEISASGIQYFNTSDSYYMFTTIVAVNVQNLAEEPTNKTILLGGTSCMYVSLNNIYITFPNSESTLIYRTQIENETIGPMVSGIVPGYVLNQFSMDEHDDYFRIATTTGHVARILEQTTSKNHVYVLNMHLSIVGRREDLAPGEKIYSARFMGDRCYLVTFVKTDPLWVIDLSDPTNPAVLGELEIPGYSDYLHPYDEDHIIGVGKETVEAEEGDFAWYQGVKISLFDVSNVSDPKQIANYTIGDRGTDSPILRDHKAFLFDKSRNLLVIPVQVSEIDETKYLEGVPSYVSGTPVWQGAYVFNITLTDGLVLRGNITHLENGITIGDDSLWVNRALYIENVLYTVSNKKIKMNSLEDLAFLKEIELP
jgi:inhibitor of cysteine peptidase